jgi:hypothetical protein
MNKAWLYLSQRADAASKNSMCFTLGAVFVKGGKIISRQLQPPPTPLRRRRGARAQRKPMSMHAEMHAISSLTGMSPSFRKQQQGARTGSGASTLLLQSLKTPSSIARAPTSTRPPSRPNFFKRQEPFATCKGHPHRL